MTTNYHHSYGISTIVFLQYTTTNRLLAESQSLHHQSGGSALIRPKFPLKEIEGKKKNELLDDSKTSPALLCRVS